MTCTLKTTADITIMQENHHFTLMEFTLIMADCFKTDISDLATSLSVVEEACKKWEGALKYSVLITFHHLGLLSVNFWSVLSHNCLTHNQVEGVFVLFELLWTPGCIAVVE